MFPHLFFPADLPPFVAQIASFSTFAVGFVARPQGGMLFGHYGDTHGRKQALVIAMLLMGLAPTIIGLLPGYATAGVLAPLALVALRFLQGLAVGGQWGGAALLAIESAPPGKRGFYGSFVQIGVPPVEATHFWLHLGANVAARDWRELPGALTPLPNVDAQRVLSISPELLPVAQGVFAGQLGYESPVSSTVLSAGELDEVIKAGYAPAAGVFGIHRYHHVEEDDARCLHVPATVAAADGFRRLLLAVTT